MKHIKIAAKQAPALVQGCMRIDAMSMEEVETLTDRIIELGTIFFDHADIYGGGMCEE